MEFVKCVESYYGFEETVERIKDASERKCLRFKGKLG